MKKIARNLLEKNLSLFGDHPLRNGIIVALMGAFSLLGLRRLQKANATN